MAYINKDYTWTKQNRLKDISVYYEEDHINSSFFKIELPSIIGFGKSLGWISFDGHYKNGLRIQEYSPVKFEAYDYVENTVFYSLTKYNPVGGKTPFYIDFREDPEIYKHSLKSGVGTLVILATLEGESVPDEWKNVINYKVTYPINLSSDSINSSPIIFQDLNAMQVSASFQEVVFQIIQLKM